MNRDDKAKNVRASARDASGGKDPEMEEIIDLVDEVPPDDDSSRLKQDPEVGTETEVDDEGIIELTDVVETGTGIDDESIIELTDVVEESSSDTKIGDATLEGGAEEILDLVGEQGSEEEEPVELVDEIVPEVDSEQEQEEIVEVDDSAEGLDSVAEKTGSPELSEVEISIAEPDEDSLTDTLREKLSDEKLEEIITRVAKQTIEEKVERILLEAAESAIAREIERLKQAL
jgi:hypothetical protein